MAVLLTALPSHLLQLAFAIAILVILSMDLMPSGECLFTTASQSVNVCQLSRARKHRCRCTPGGRALRCCNECPLTS